MVCHHSCFCARRSDVDLERHRRTADTRQNNHRQSSLSGYIINGNKFHPTITPNTQLKRGLKGKVNELGGSGLKPSGSDAASTSKQTCELRGYEQRPTVVPSGDSVLESSESSDSSESDITPCRKQRSKRTKSIVLEDSSDGEPDAPATDMTPTRKVFLQALVDRVRKENQEDSEPFAQPVDVVAEETPDYHTIITRPMDLRTLNDNLSKGIYSTVEEFEAEFRLMIENSIEYNGRRHEVSQAGLRLSRAFNILISSLPSSEQRCRGITRPVKRSRTAA